MVKRILFILLVVLASCDTSSHWTRKYVVSVDKPGEWKFHTFSKPSQVDSLFYEEFGIRINSDSLMGDYPPYMEVDIGNTSFYCEEKWAHKNRTFKIWEDE